MQNRKQKREISWGRFLAWETSSRDTIDFKKIYVDIADDLIAGLMLSQIIYWYLPGKNDETKLRVRHDEKLWLAKKYDDWYNEIRISAKQAKRAIKILEKRGIIETALYKFNGAPTKHIRLLQKKFLNIMVANIDNYWINTKGINGKEPKGLMEKNQRDDSLTKNTSKNTTSSSGHVTYTSTRNESEDSKIDDDQKAQNPPPASFDPHKNKSSSSENDNLPPHQGKTQYDPDRVSPEARFLTEHLDDTLRLNGCMPLAQSALVKIPHQFEQFLQEYDYEYIQQVISDVIENLAESNGFKKISSANYFKDALRENIDDWQSKQVIHDKQAQAVSRHVGGNNE